MKLSNRLLLVLVCLTIPIAQQSILAQGSLTPPGPPGPTMKSLDELNTNILQVSNIASQATNRLAQVSNQVFQVSNRLASVETRLKQVEARFPISDYQTNLTVPGSYYLITNLFSGTNLNDAINVRTNVHDITIDLNGFSIINTNGAGGASPVGVRISEGTNIVIRNGMIEGFDRAVRAEGLFYGVVVENIQIHNCRRAGIEGNGVIGDMTQTINIRNCVIEGMDGTGEAASVSVDGITVLNCTAHVQNCIIRDIIPAGSGVGSCIDAQSCTNSIFDGNYLANAGVGLKTTGSGTRYFYRNNLTAGCTTPFSVAGGVDRGGNF